MTGIDAVGKKPRGLKRSRTIAEAASGGESTSAAKNHQAVAKADVTALECGVVSSPRTEKDSKGQQHEEEDELGCLEELFTSACEHYGNYEGTVACIPRAYVDAKQTGEALLLYRGVVHECDRLKRADKECTRGEEFARIFGMALFWLGRLENQTKSEEEGDGEEEVAMDSDGNASTSMDYYRVACMVLREGLENARAPSSTQRSLQLALACTLLAMIPMSMVDRMDNAEAEGEEETLNVSDLFLEAMSLIKTVWCDGSVQERREMLTGELPLLFYSAGEQMQDWGHEMLQLFHTHSTALVEMLRRDCEAETLSRGDNYYLFPCALGSFQLSLAVGQEDQQPVDGENIELEEPKISPESVDLLRNAHKNLQDALCAADTAEARAHCHVLLCEVCLEQGNAAEEEHQQECCYQKAIQHFDSCQELDASAISPEIADIIQELRRA